MLIENIKQFPRQLHCCDVIGHMTLADGVHHTDIKVHKVYLMSHLFRIALGYLKRASSVFFYLNRRRLKMHLKIGLYPV